MSEKSHRDQIRIENASEQNPDMPINQTQTASSHHATKLGGTSDSERQQWIDIARGVGIFLVVLGHVNRGLVSSGVIPATNSFLVTDYVIYTFHMPLFFLLAGLTMRLQIEKSTKGIFWRLFLIAYAYFLWSTGQLLLRFYFSDYVSQPVSLSDLKHLAYAPSGQQFWFLYALMICHLIFLMTLGRAILIVLAIIIFSPVQFSDLGIISIAAHFFIFYAVGVLLMQQINSLRPSLILVASLGVLFAIGSTLNWVRGVDYSSLEALPTACLGIATVLVSSKLIAGPSAAVLATMGRLSLPIFLAHVIAGSGMRVAMVRLGAPHDAALYLFCCVAAGIVLPMLLYWALASFRLLPIFGFAPFDSYLKKGSRNLAPQRP